jgi:hypothetical protein
LAIELVRTLRLVFHLALRQAPPDPFIAPDDFDQGKFQIWEHFSEETADKPLSGTEDRPYDPSGGSHDSNRPSVGDGLICVWTSVGSRVREAT